MEKEWPQPLLCSRITLGCAHSCLWLLDKNSQPHILPLGPALGSVNGPPGSSLNAAASSRAPEMKGLLTLAWFLAYSVLAVPGDLLGLKSMIEKVTGKNALINYGFYGCYCGWGGRGTPKDGTDWCCWVHDLCYGRLEDEGCHIRTQPYRYRFARGLVTCELGPLCQMQLCDCDRKLVYCLRRNLNSYDPRYQYFPNIFCT
ncbi:Phospholipase A2 Group V [Manis pentadactyla]|nr:Phospholipase A2 Group V [Manis pentadactyla]